MLTEWARMLRPSMIVVDHVVLAYFIALHLVYIFLFLVSFFQLIRHHHRNLVPFSRGFLRSPLTLSVS